MIEFLENASPTQCNGFNTKKERMTGRATVVEPADTAEITSIVRPPQPCRRSHQRGGARQLETVRRQVHRIAPIYSASVRMKELLDEVLIRYSGIDRNLEPCDLRELVVSAMDKVALVAEAQSVQLIPEYLRNLVITLDRQPPTEFSSICS